MRTLENTIRAIYHLLSTGVIAAVLSWVGEYAEGDPETRAWFLAAFLGLAMLNWLIFDIAVKVPKRVTQGLVAFEPTDQEILDYTKED